MARITKFEDINAWTRARKLANRVYELSDEGRFSRDFALRDQMRRAVISILSNIAEGFERGGNKEFIQFLAHAKGSAGELKAQLYLALDRRYLTAKQFEELSREAVEVGRMIGGLMDYLKRSNLRGPKYRNPLPQRGTSNAEP